MKVTRCRTRLNKATLEVVFYITSLPRGAASAETLLRLIRGHWAIENRLHYVRDVTFGEDRSRIRKGHGPENMALLRNLAIGLFRRSSLGRRKGVYLPTVIHAHQADPRLALALVRPGIPRPASDGDLPVNTG